MPRNGHSKPWLPAGAILIVVALACGILWFRKSDSERTTTTATPSTPAESPLPDKADPVEPAETSSIQPARTAADVSEPSGASSLRIHVIDAVTGAPVPGAKCFVESASDGTHHFGTFVTDADGRGTSIDLPPATLVVHVLRKPPHASGYVAVEMPAGESRDLEVRLTAGGTLVGRAVDDAAQPVADAEVSIDSERNDVLSFGGADDWDVVTRTGVDGRFEIQNVVSRPIRVSIVDGETRAQIWTNVSVRLQSGLAVGHARHAVADGARIDLGDIVLPRGRAFAGHVLDAHRAPVEGALVDLAHGFDNRSGTGYTASRVPEEVKLDATKSLTDVDGSFRAHAPPQSKYATVSTKAGIFEQFLLPEATVPPADLELVLKDWSILELEFVDEAGSPVTTSAPLVRAKYVHFLSADRQVAGNAGRLNVRVEFGGKRQIHAEVVAGADGVFRIQSAGTTGMSRRLHCELPGWSPIDEEIGAQSAPIERRKLTLHLLPTMRVHVSVAEQPPTTPQDAKRMLYVQACLLDAAAYTNTTNLPGKGPAIIPGSKCCGQGSMWMATLEAREQDIELPVLAQGNYWVHAEVPSTRKNEKGDNETWIAFEAHIGPFPADGTSHEVSVPSVELPRPREDHRGPPPASKPGMTSVTGRIIDAVTQKGIDYASLSMSPVPNPESPLGTIGYSVDHEGRLREKVLRPGRYSMRIYARKYRIPTLEDVTIVEDETLDLGTIALAPMPMTVLHLVEADGRPAPRGTHVDMRGESDSSLVQASVKGVDGTIELQEELGPGVKIRVREDRADSDVDNLSGIQWLTHDFRPEESVVELRLRKWQPIEVRVSGEIHEYPAALVWCLVDEVGATPSWMRSNRLVEVLAAPDGTRIFRGEVGGPGTLQAAVSCTLLQPFSQTIDIQDHADVQTFLLTPIR